MPSCACSFLLTFAVLSVAAASRQAGVDAALKPLPLDPVRLVTGASRDVLLLRIQIPGLAAVTTPPNLADNSDARLPGKVDFQFFEQTDPGDSKSVLLFRVRVEGFPPAWSERRSAILTLGNARFPLPYIVTNIPPDKQQLTVQGPASPVLLAGGAGPASIDVVTGDSPATGLIVAASTIAEKDAGQALDASRFQLSLAPCVPEGESKPVILARNSRTRVNLCLPSVSAHGEFSGNIFLSAPEYPAGAAAPVKLFSTSRAAKLGGFGLLCFGVAAAWLSKTYFANRISRDQALLGVALLRQRAGTLLDCISKLHADFPMESADLFSYLEDLLENKLQTKFAEAQLFISPELPLPFQFSPRTAQFTTLLNQTDTTLNAINAIVDNGCRPIREMLPPAHTANKAHFQTAVLELNKIFTDGADANTARQRARAAVTALIAAIGEPIVSAAAAQAAPPSVNVLMLELRRISQINWTILLVLTVLAGWAALIARNPGFGKPTDLLFCLFWGFGLPITINSLLPNSVLNSFSGSSLKVTAIV